MMDEREAFIQFIQNASEQELALIDALSYRRILKPDEKQMIWETLKGKWKINDNYWYPLAKSEIEQIAAFRIDDSTKNFFQDRLLTILTEKRIKRLFEIREGGIAYEEDLALFDLGYDGNEVFLV